MRKRIVRFIGWLIELTGRLARRVLGAIVAASVGFPLLLLLLILAGDRVPLGDSGTILRLIASAAVVVGGTLVLALIGFLFPGPPLTLLRFFDWLPDGNIGLFDDD